MPEQFWYESVGFFALGILGFAIRLLWTFVMSGQRKLSAFDDYVEDNSAIVLLGFLFYCGLAALWMWTDAMALIPDWAGVSSGILNGWTVLLGFLSDVLFMFLVNKFGEKVGVDKLGDKVAGLMPKVSKDDGTPPPTA